MPWKQPKPSFVSANSKDFAPKLRRNMTEAERVLWKALRSEIVLPDSHFRRQVAIGPYIADFCSLRHRVIVEVDGEIHATLSARRHDAERDEYLRAQGFRILRSANHEVTRTLSMVLDRLKRELEFAIPTPNLSPQGGGGLGRP